MSKQPWQQELIWVQRNGANVIVGMRDTPPQDEDFTPTAPATSRKEVCDADE